MSVKSYCRGELWEIRRDRTVREAAVLMDHENVGCLVVVEGGEPIGILTDRDVALDVLRSKRDPDALRVDEIMRRPVVTIPEDAPLRGAIDRMRSEGVRRLPVVDAQGRVTGIITSDDLAVLLGRELGQLAGPIAAQLPSPVPSLEEKRREQAIEWSE